jgi:hypothetical protein
MRAARALRRDHRQGALVLPLHGLWAEQGIMRFVMQNTHSRAFSPSALG